MRVCNELHQQIPLRQKWHLGTGSAQPACLSTAYQDPVGWFCFIHIFLPLAGWDVGEAPIKPAWVSDLFGLRSQ